jgi:hypothetical protein
MQIAAERRTSVRSSRGSYTSSRTSLACSAIGPRPFQGLLARLAAKIAAYTCGQHLPICSSVGHCAIWRISWFEKICISRLSILLLALPHLPDQRRTNRIPSTPRSQRSYVGTPSG